MDPVLPVFLGIALDEQIKELREYLVANGACIDIPGPEDLYKNLTEIFLVCGESTKNCSELEIEGFLNSVLSLIFAVHESRHNIICEFVQCLVNMRNHVLLRHKLLTSLFCGLSNLDPVRYYVYCGQLELAAKSGFLELITTDLDQVKSWLADWNDVEKSRRIFNLLHDSFLRNGEKEKSLEAMVELLRTYPEDNAAEAKKNASDCIVSFVNRENVWLFDHLLELGPIKSLKDELIHKILEIFITGNIHDYMTFYQENSNFMASSGLNHENCVKKMRVLTFVTLVNNCDEVSFQELSKKLDINISDVESFIIDVLKTRLARVRIDGMKEKIITSSAAHRTFGKPQWLLLKNKLQEWQVNLQTVQKQLVDIQPVHPI